MEEEDIMTDPFSQATEEVGGAIAAAPAAPDDALEGVQVTRVAEYAGVKIEYGSYLKKGKRKRTYWINGSIVPSVTEVLDVLSKDALPWWGMKVGALGTVALFNGDYKNADGTPGTAQLAPTVTQEAWGEDVKLAALHAGEWKLATGPLVVDLLKAHKLTVNDVKEEAAERGQTVHDAFERWGTSGELPDPTDESLFITEEQRAFTTGLVKFLTSCDFRVDAQEVMVGSAEHGYAGRYDCRGVMMKDATLHTRVYPVRAPKNVFVPAGTKLMLDLKSSKDIYESHGIQLEAYEPASIECGYDPTDYRAVLHVTADGDYQFRPIRPMGIEPFLGVKAAFEAVLTAREAIRP